MCLRVKTVLAQVEGGHQDPRQTLLVPAELAILVDTNSSRSTSSAGKINALRCDLRRSSSSSFVVEAYDEAR